MRDIRKEPRLRRLALAAARHASVFRSLVVLLCYKLTYLSNTTVGRASDVRVCLRQNSTVIDTAGVRSMPRSKPEMYVPLRRDRNGSLLWEK